MFDILIRNGQIIDGTKRPAYVGDVGIRGDRIAEIGDLASASAERTVDASGHIVAPGFIDVHNHSDGLMLRYPHLAAKTLQGYTTEVLMADGISYAPVDPTTAREWIHYLRSLNGLMQQEYQGWESLEDYMQLLDSANVQNAAAHAPYANLRAMACGFGRVAVDDFQMREIKHGITSCMEQGAVGLSTGLDYIAQCYSTTEELIAACRALTPYQGLYVTHVRYKLGLLPALREAVAIGREAGIPVHISHLKGQSPAEVEQVLHYIDQVARKEVDFSFDVYPYQPGSTMLNYLLPYDVWDQGPLAALAALRSPELRARFARGLKAYRLELDRIRIAWVGSEANRRHHGKTLSQYVQETGKPPEEALFNLLLDENLAVLLVFDEGDDALVEPFLQHDLQMVGTDGILLDDGLVHPRGFGSTGRFLGRLVRDRQLMSWEEAIYKLAGFPARRFRLVDRGEVRKSACADLVVFHPQQILDRATYDNPRQPCQGIQHVLVNGKLIVTGGQPCPQSDAPLAGRFLRRDR